MSRIFALLVTAWSLMPTVVLAASSVVMEGKADGPGGGKHVVFLAGDEEYRSEEGLAQMAKILAVRHGFKCTVLFSLDAQGVIDPTASNSLAEPATLRHAAAIFMMLRFREWPDETMRHFVDAYLAGKPIIGLRTSTHAFRYKPTSTSPFRKYSHQSTEWEGGFGHQVLGQTWIGHHGRNHQEATRSIVEPASRNDPILRGVGQILGDSGTYRGNPQADATLLLRGEVLAGMTRDSPLESSGKNNPVQPIAWHRTHRNEAGRTNKVFCSTLGAATDMLDENFRRLLVNAVYWSLDLPVPEKANVQLVGDYRPTEYGMRKFRKGVKPADLALTAAEK